MMKTVLAILMVLMLSLTSLTALAEEDATVTALGSATVTLTPDMASFTVGVTTQDAQVKTAQEANAAAMNGVIDTIKAQGVAPADIQTQNYSVNPVYDYQTGKLGDQQSLVGYTVSNTVTITVRALDTLPALMDAAITAGANQLYGVSFASSQTDAAMDQAMTAATQDALRKAKLLADAVGRTLGDVQSVTEVNDSYISYSGARALAYDKAEATPIEAGTMTVTASVRVEVGLK